VVRPIVHLKNELQKQGIEFQIHVSSDNLNSLFEQNSLTEVVHTYPKPVDFSSSPTICS
jgi:hypothetical protein